VKALVVLALVAVAPRAEAKGCHEVSDVVGYHHCTRFANDWSRESDAPRLSVDFGWFYHRFTMLPFALDATRATDSSSDFATTAHGVGVRVLGGIGHVLYTGLELDGGDNDTLPRPVGLQPTDGFYMSPNAVFGAHLFERVRIALSTELAGGVRFDSVYTCAKCQGPVASEWRRQLEARVRVDAFIHPHVSFGFSYGHSLLDAGDQMWMLSIGIHGRTMDGMY